MNNVRAEKPCREAPFGPELRDRAANAAKHLLARRRLLGVWLAANDTHGVTEAQRPARRPGSVKSLPGATVYFVIAAAAGRARGRRRSEALPTRGAAACCRAVPPWRGRGGGGGVVVE